MDKKTRNIFLAMAMLLTGSAVFTACNNRHGEEPRDSSPIYLLPLSGGYHDNELGGTRAMPAGFTVYDPAETTNIDVFMTTNTGGGKRGTFSNETGTWRSDIGVEHGEHFYVYGFLPKEAVPNASVAPLDGGYDNGVVMTLAGLSPISTSDVCVVVGVKQGDSRRLPITDVEGLLMGQFGFTGRSSVEGNYIYMLLNHIYASIGFQIRVDANYNDLRTIKLKSMTLETEAASSSTATVTLRANNGGDDPIEGITWSSVSGTKEITLFSNPTGLELTTAFIDLNPAVFANIVNGRIVMRCTYDVYDKAGNLTRANCETENLLPAMSVSNHGERTLVRLTVNPTYLYVLSDADLDNPTLTIE